jgi:large subunit ribosomal protein L24
LSLSRQIASQPRKVRSALHRAPIHARRSWLSAPLSKDLKEKHRLDNIELRKGDTVKIARGDFKGIEGKVVKVFPELGRITIEGVTREKLKGGTVPVKVHASKVIVTGLNLDDKARRKGLERT